MTTRFTSSSLFKLVAILTFIASFSACSILTNKANSETGLLHSESDWPSTRQALSELNNWKVMGKIGIRTNTEAMTAAINQWTQNDDTFIIDLSSTFFGLGATRILGDQNFISIIEPNEKPISSNQPDQLIEQALGFPLPISNLTSWIKAIPTTGIDYQLSFNSHGLPLQLTQNDWQINYSKYSLQYGLPLPGKIKLKHGDTHITLAIKKWTLL